MKSRIAAALLLSSIGAAVAAQSTQTPPEQPPVSFRVEINLVEVDAFVTDAQGNAVSGLTAADFEVVEDGRPQKITSFIPVGIPLERAERPLFASAPRPPVKTIAAMSLAPKYCSMNCRSAALTRGVRVMSV